MRARGAGYEELHAAGGGILSTVRATRAAGEDELQAAVHRHREWMLRAGTTTFESQVGLRARPRDRVGLSSGRSSQRTACPPGSAPTRCRLSSPTPMRISTSRWRRCCRRLLGWQRRRTCSSSKVPSTRHRPGATSRPVVTRASRSACTATSSPRRGARRSPPSSARARSITSRRPGRKASARSRRAKWSPSLLPVSALFLGRPMPPARALADAGAAIALRDRLQPW